MSVKVINNTSTKSDIEISREEYKDYIKITADIHKEIVAIDENIMQTPKKL